MIRSPRISVPKPLDSKEVNGMTTYTPTFIDTRPLIVKNDTDIIIHSPPSSGSVIQPRVLPGKGVWDNIEEHSNIPLKRRTRGDKQQVENTTTSLMKNDANVSGRTRLMSYFNIIIT